ncbi:MAG: TlyA family RNA methyltransferase [Paenibacillaceae bacterium]|jgi:23S rRNA (cytidine1920-2'-O)/16S rRNA (cytidine1409-2'-O)-methyltransferase|nr:TlyA family RNA methyltransferase [Paenibacillaceae bacterium]
MTQKQRIDVLLVEQGLAPSREKARALIMAGAVYIGCQQVDKPGMRVLSDAPVTVKGATLRYVGRGGLKLEHALHTFGVDCTDRVVLDIGASTGGFTDCVLAHGAQYVYALDVGHNQLAWSLRTDARVCVMEKTHFLRCDLDGFSARPPTLIVADVSFISLRLLIARIAQLLPDDGAFIGLIKPQFEALPADVGARGIVSDARVHRTVLRIVIAAMARVHLGVRALTHSPITGAKGNIEFIVHATKTTHSFVWAQRWVGQEVQRVVSEAHAQLNRCMEKE